MSADITEPVEPAAETAADGTTTDAPDISAELEKWKALARKNEARAKENSEKAKRLDEIEEASKSELEKAQAKLAELERERDEANAARIRSEIARTKGVPVELLNGSDEDTLTAQADALLSFKGTAPAAPSSNGQGKQGEPVTAGVQQITSLDELNKLTAAEINQARKEGRLDSLMGKS